MNQGKLTLREVGGTFKEIIFSQDDDWVQNALKKAAPHEDLSAMTPEEWAKNSSLQGSMRVERLDPEYSLFGSFEGRVPLLCPRCGNEGTSAKSGEFRLFIRPLGPRESEERGDDPDYIFIETPYIDLSEILAEQIVATEQVVEYPDLDSEGNPHECGDLKSHESDELPSRQSDGKAGKSPFEVLGKLKDLTPVANQKNTKK